MLSKIDKQLQTVLTEFSSLAKQIEFQDVCLLSDRKTIEQQCYPGIYKIDIKVDSRFSGFKDWIDWFEPAWDIPALAKKFTPTTKLKRIKKHNELKEWMPVYLGKSKRIAGRVIEHIELGLDKPTFAMKLRERGAFFFNNTFRLSAVRVEVANYDLLVPMLERAFRDQVNPIVGKQ
jgi:hypothetical protein